MTEAAHPTEDLVRAVRAAGIRDERLLQTTIEMRPESGRQARSNLARQGIRDVELRIGDGSGGVPDHAPYDAVIVSSLSTEHGARAEGCPRSAIRAGASVMLSGSPAATAAFSRGKVICSASRCRSASSVAEGFPDIIGRTDR
ncbi:MULTISPECIES: hypothetical protein [Streptomyces]|nr:hypothetical protein [Streptomyces sp. AK02-04a]MDX3758521.1 hypothetical protein [Streptomyces sp. AK02-04a]